MRKKRIIIIVSIFILILIAMLGIYKFTPLNQTIRELLGLPRSVFYVNNVPVSNPGVIDYIKDDVFF